MKKSLIGLIVLALVVIPAAAMAAKAVDISIGGYIKLHMFWDSATVGKNLGAPPARSNAGQLAQTGRFRMSSTSSRFNFKIKGPKLWGANTSGYIEMDFETGVDNRYSATNSYQPRLRHAFFRMDWAQVELLMGQYWGLFVQYVPETIEDAGLIMKGYSYQRAPQIRVTFRGGPWTIAGLICDPYNPSAADQGTAAFLSLPGSPLGNTLQGAMATFPQIQIGATFEKDLYGKAGYYSRPRGLSLNVVFGITRIRYFGGQTGANTWGQNNYAGLVNGVVQQDNQTLTPWAVQVGAFIPVLPTRTPNLANTASVSLSFFVGQGVSFFFGGRDQDNSFFKYKTFDPVTGRTLYDRCLTKRYGGYIQAQYYFTNQWFLTYIYGFSKAFGVPQDRDLSLALIDAGSNGYTYATNQDQSKMWQIHNLILYFRPIKAFKFGLAYTYVRADYFQKTTVGSRITDHGDDHRVQFAGWFYF